MNGNASSGVEDWGNVEDSQFDEWRTGDDDGVCLGMKIERWRGLWELKWALTYYAG